MVRVTLKSFFECLLSTKTKIQANHQVIKYILHIRYIHVLLHIKKKILYINRERYDFGCFSAEVHGLFT